MIHTVTCAVGPIIEPEEGMLITAMYDINVFAVLIRDYPERWREICEALEKEKKAHE